MRLLAAITALTISLFATPLAAAELVMVEEPGCPWCLKWDQELGAIYPKTPEGKFAPMRKVQLHDVRAGDAGALGFSVKHPVVYTPTFLLIEDGAEVARLQGYPGEDFFWGLLERMLIEETSYERPTATTLPETAVN
ncbi:thioredoxin family protein [Aliiroseovarius sp. 2305UL8-7]|uniref:thioredoxin family protein n=1 Tax=Aliiroseovarius conchicola TaxID=3121637 RepID=UPI003528DABE